MVVKLTKPVLGWQRIGGYCCRLQARKYTASSSLANSLPTTAQTPAIVMERTLLASTSRRSVYTGRIVGSVILCRMVTRSNGQDWWYTLGLSSKLGTLVELQCTLVWKIRSTKLKSQTWTILLVDPIHTVLLSN